MLDLDEVLVAEVLQIVFEWASFAVVERLAEIRCADDAEATGLAQELLLFRTKFQTDDVAGGTRRTARVCRGNRAAVLTWDVLSRFTVSMLCGLAVSASVGSLLGT